MFKQALLSLLCCLFFMTYKVQASAVDINLLDKLDDVAENVSDTNKRLDGKHTIIKMLVKCEFDEQCELNMIPELETLSKQDKNIMYKGFLTYLKWEKNDLAFNIKHCQIPEKKEVRKAFAQCYGQWVDDETNHPPQNREEIDKAETDRYRCLEEKVKPLAEQGNLFGMAEMVNLNEHFTETKELNLWTAKIEAQKGTAKYQLYMKCSELP